MGVLALYGDFGTGKTHLLAAVTNAHIASGKACLFASVVSLFDAIGERLEQRQDYHDLLRRAIQTPLLVLDDIDKLKPSEFREETLYKLLNGRCTAGLPLAISSNSTPCRIRALGGQSRAISPHAGTHTGTDERTRLPIGGKSLKKSTRTMQPVEPLLLTIPQVSVMLGLGRTKVYDLIDHEGLPTVKLGTARRIPRQALEVWLKERIA